MTVARSGLGDDAGPWTPPPRVPVVGLPVSATSYDEVLDLILRRPGDRASVFCFCNVHAVMTARRDPALAAALTAADVTASDGMPLVWMLRRLGVPDQQRVYGPDFMLHALRAGVEHGLRHFLYGTTDETLDRLVASCHELAPGVDVAGRFAPPFRDLTDADVETFVAAVRDADADVVWVGMGLPKQELWMDRVRDRLPGVALCGVGSAFDHLSGTVPQAPDWIQERGLEWLYRLMREPRRLWRRYVLNNPLFVVLATRQLLRSRGVR